MIKRLDDITELSVNNPFNDDILATLKRTPSSDLDSIVRNAEIAFENISRHMTPYQRYEILSSVANKIKTNRDELAVLITKESGKPLKDSFVEVDRANQTFLIAAEESKNIRGETIPCDVTPVRTEKLAFTNRVPLGVIACITPFNFPLNLVAHKIGPAIAAGNSVVLKPSSLTPLTALKLREYFLESDIPADSLQILLGTGAIGQELASKKQIRLVSFTGSVLVGKQLSLTPGIKKLALELGGNDPLIIMPDSDIEKASQIAVEHGFGSNGQRCTGIKRVLVHKEIEKDFTKILLNLTKNLKVGDPLLHETDVGPLITIDAAIEVKKRIDKALENGAKLLIGGKYEGSIVYPTVLKNVKPDEELVMEETFGPVVPIITFDDIDDAIDICNSTDYGLQAGVFTTNLDLVKKQIAS